MKHFGMFAKYWEPGQVKTRLGRDVGAESASNLYRCFVQRLLQRCERVADRRILCYWPEERRDCFQQIAPSAWQLAPQNAGDLGLRIESFFQESISQGAERIVLVGSDSPTLPLEYLEQAFELLKRHPVVLGPATDGGYYAIGIAGQVPPIFQGVAWSTPAVWDQTVGALREARVPFATLPRWYDVDQIEDLRRLCDEVEQLHAAGCGWERLLRAVRSALQNARNDDAHGSK